MSSIATPETDWNMDFVQVAHDLKPLLHHWTRPALSLIEFEPDDQSYFGFRRVPVVTKMNQFEEQVWGSGEEFILDFGIHMVGSLSMNLEARLAHMDAPCRLRLTFGESPLDVTLGMENVKTWISTSWLPDEVINIDVSPAEVCIPRRHAFRFLRVEILATSPKYKVSFSNVRCNCVSSVAQDQEIQMPSFNSTILSSIDQVSIFTLRECMQSVFEDGPRRDRRLWLGDLRLQALANYATFKDFDLVKRCIFMFAAVARQDGSIPACIFDSPELSPSTDYIVDYDALFAAVVEDYVTASGDVAAGVQLWSTVLGCLRRPLSHLDPDQGTFDVTRGQGFKFLDWQTGLHREAGCHGLLLYCLKAANRLAEALHKPAPFENEVLRMTQGARHFLDDNGNFVSGPDSQRSLASASWLTLSGAFETKVARKALLNTFRDTGAVQPLTPYLWHYVCDALAQLGCYDECVALITDYWGGMLNAGADTFWEAFDSRDHRASPYGDVRNNSFCHAWSCTPSYLLRVKLADHVIKHRQDDLQEITMQDLDFKWIEATVFPRNL